MAVEKEEEKGRRKAGGEEERERSTEAKTDSIAAHGYVGLCDTCCEKTTSLSTVLQRGEENKRVSKISQASVCFSFL